MERFGNHLVSIIANATNAKNAVEYAREKVAKLLGAEPEEIIFTAGATESSNFIIKGYLDYRKVLWRWTKSCHYISSRT